MPTHVDFAYFGRLRNDGTFVTLDLGLGVQLFGTPKKRT